MAVLIDNSFASNVTGWTTSSGTFSHVASEGSDFSTGYGSLAGNSTTYQTFTTVSTGTLRVDFWWYDSGTTTGTTHNTLFYILPDSTISSANSAATIAISRDTALGASSTEYNLTYRSSAGFVQSINMRRDAWVKITVFINISARTYDLYLNDVCYQRGIASANTTYTSLDRVAAVTQASAPATYFDNVRVESSWTTSETTIIEQDFVGGSGEIEDNKPTTDTRNSDKQKWVIPYTTTSYGAFTLGANGAAPDTSKACLALFRCTADGIIESEFKTSVSGTAYFGLVFRFWDYPSSTGAGAGLFRVFGGASNTAVLFLPDATGTRQTVQSIALTPTANTTYTLKIELRGRYVICSYKAAAMDSGSYTVAFTHQITSSATGGRGMIAEEYHGPFIDTASGATDNYVRRFRFTGVAHTAEVNPTVGEYKYSLDAGSIKSLSNSSAGGSDQNIFHSRGIQFSHRSRADGDYAIRQQTVFDLTHCKVYEQRVNQMTEYEFVGDGRPFVTLLRRGPWIADNLRVFNKTTYAEYWTPDWDLLGRYITSGYRYIGATGTSTNGTNTSAHDWAIDAANQTLPVGMQKITTFPSGDLLRLTQVIRSASTNTDTLQGDITSKWEQTGDPASFAWGVPPANLSNSTTYTAARGYLLERGSALTLDATTIEGWRDDVKTPATFSYTTGSNKTNATGDYNSDGFNERHGWYEVNASGDVLDCTFTVGGITRYQPVFRIWGLSATSKTVTIAGSAGVSGTDYVLEDMGDGNALLQILSNRASNTTLRIAGGAISGTASLTQASQTSSASGTVAIVGMASITQAAQTSSATGTIAIAATLSQTQAGDTLSAAGLILSGPQGTLSATQANNTMSAAAAVAIGGTLTATQTSQTVSASGYIGSPPTAVSASRALFIEGGLFL